MATNSEPNWESLLWGIVVAGCYDRRKLQCELPNDAAIIEAWEQARKERNGHLD